MSKYENDVKKPEYWIKKAIYDLLNAVSCAKDHKRRHLVARLEKILDDLKDLDVVR